MSSDFISMFEKRMSAIFDNKLFDDYVQKELVPLSHFTEKDSKWILEVDLPGVNKKDIGVTLTPNHLIIRAKLEETYCVKKHDFVVEFDYFRKVVDVPSGVDTKKISAIFKNGILVIIIPKLSTGKRIPIE